MTHLNPDVYFLKKDNYNYIFSPQNPDILQVSDKVFNNIRKNRIKNLKSETISILKSNNILIEKQQDNTDITNLTLKITSKCNFNCAFCSQKYIPVKEIEMKWDIAKVSVDKFLQLNQSLYNIGFFGGEPLLHVKLIKKIINYVKQKYSSKNVMYEINTNGFLLDKNINWLDKKDILLAISVRGNKEYYLNNNEYIKYQKIFDTLKIFKNKQNIIINIVVETSNINYLESLIDEFSKINIKEFALCIPSFDISKFWSDKEKFFAKKIMDLFKKCFQENLNLIFSDWGFWSNRKYNCRALSGTSIYINTNGEINLCHSIPFVLGNILTDDINDLIITFKKFPKYIKHEIKFCSKCKIKNFCRGGCFADKRINRAKNHTFCNFAKEFFNMYIDYLINKNEVILINPPYGELSYKPMKVPPISLAFIAKSLHNHKINYKLFDFGYESIDYSKKIIKNNPAKFFGISFSQENCQIAFELIKFIKKQYPCSKIIIGGIFPTLAHKEILLEFNEIDFIVRGEGEKAILNIINNTFQGDKGISFRKKGKLFFSKKINRIKNFDSFSPPIYENEIINDYNLILRESEANINIIPIIWSRGCNHNCSFCTINPANYWRCRSNKSVIFEIKEKYNQKTENHVIFFDANPMQNPRRFINLIKEIRRKFKVSFSCSGRADTIVKNSDIIAQLAKLGCEYIEVGVESFDNNVLKYYSKGISKKDIERCFQLLNNNNISIELDFMLFNPYTTKKELLFNLKELDRFGFKNNLSIDALFSYSKLYFGTKLRQDYESKEKKLFNYKYIPKISELFVHKNVKEIYFNLIKLKIFIKKIYDNAVFTERLIKSSNIKQQDIKEFVLLHLLLKLNFFEGYVDIIKKGKYKVKIVTDKLRSILKKIDKLKSLKTINFS